MIGLVKIAAVGTQHDVMGLLLVTNDDSFCRLACNF